MNALQTRLGSAIPASLAVLFSLNVLFFLAVLPGAAGAITNRYVEDFHNRQYCDRSLTTAAWDTVAGELKLPPFVMSVGGNCDLGQSFAVAVDGNYAYVADFSTGVKVLDVHDPTAPAIVGSSSTAAPANDIAVDGDLGFVACGYSGLKILRITTPSSPLIIGTIALSGSATGVAVAGNIAYVAAGTAGLHVIRVSTPSAPTRIGGYDTAGTANAVAISGNRAYIADVSDGLVILDVTNPAAPTLLGSYDTAGNAVDVAVAGPCAYVADHTGGVAIIDVSNPSHPTLVSTVATPGLAYDVAAVGTLLYVAEYAGGVMMIDVTNPASPVVLQNRETPGDARGLMVVGEYAYVADYYSGLSIVKVDTPVPPYRLGHYGTLEIRDVAVSGKYAYGVRESNPRFVVLDISNPAQPSVVGYCSLPRAAFVVVVDGKYAYVGTDYNLSVVDITNPAAPVYVGMADAYDQVEDLAIAGDVAYLVEGGTVRTYDVTNPTTPVMIGSLSYVSAKGVAVAGDYAYVAVAPGGSGALNVYDVTDPTSPNHVGTCQVSPGARRVAIAGNYCYVACDPSGVDAVDITSGTNPVFGRHCDTPGAAKDVRIWGDRAYVADGDGGLQALDIGVPNAPVLLDGVTNPGATAGSLRLSGEVAYVGVSNGLESVAVHDHLLNASADRGRSINLNPSGLDLVRTRASTTQSDSIRWELTFNGGSSWTEVTPGGVWQLVTSPGADLRWQSHHRMTQRGVNPTCTHLEIEWLYGSALITGIQDIPHDQGGWLRMTFQRSGCDFADASPPLAMYYIWRRIDDRGALGRITQNEADRPPFVVQNGGGVRGFPPGNWEVVGSVPALQQETYIAAVPSRGDSTPEGIPYSVYCVSAHTTNPLIWYVSPPDIAYSKDNLAPAPPGNLRFQSPGLLAWDVCPDRDFDYFTAYGSAADSLDSSAVVIAYTTGTTANVSGDPYPFYHVTATDFAGNKGEASSIGGVSGVSDDPAPPAAWALRPVLPNPVRGRVAVRYDVPRNAAVRIEVFDVTGRAVRRLVDSPMAPGRHAIDWRTEGDDGHEVSSGVYFVRMQAPGFSEKRKLIVLR